MENQNVCISCGAADIATESAEEKKCANCAGGSSEQGESKPEAEAPAEEQNDTPSETPTEEKTA